MIYNNKLNNYIDISKTYLYPRFIIPTLNILQLENINLDQKILNVINEPFSIFWVDISSCANKIRNIVELILDRFKIKKTYLDKNKKTKIISAYKN